MKVSRSGPPFHRAWCDQMLGTIIAALMLGSLMLGCDGPEPAQAVDTVVSATPEQVPAVEDSIPSEAAQEKESEHEHVIGALETYRYWAGQDPEEDMQVLNGEYWASAHWTKEYSLYMELKFPRAKDFVMGRNFKRLEHWQEMRGAPDWFDPPESYQVWEGQLGSLYYLHPKKGHIYIFERQF